MRTKLYLTPEDHGRPLTWEEFESADYQEGSRYELIHGKLEVSPAPNYSQEVLREWVADALRAYARLCPGVIRRIHGPARVFLQDTGEGVTAPEPDIACYDTLPAGVPLRRVTWQDISPFLVVEVLSADTAAKDLERNRRLYAQVASIREYWVIDGRDDNVEPSLLVFSRRGRRWAARVTVPPGGTYTTDLLPGFSLLVELQGS